MSKKITIEEFMARFNRSYPSAEIELLNYTAISNPLTIRCKKCGKTYSKTRAREFLNNFTCCNAHDLSQIQKLINIYSQTEDFDFVKQLDKDRFIVHHNKCGNDLTRFIHGGLDNPFACSYCNSIKFSNMLPIEKVQETINNQFNNTIQILEYNGQLEKNKYKCLKCGLIFEQKQTCLMQSRGCPKCDRYKSMGESQFKKLLEDKNIEYKEQVSVNELPLQHFDFGLYNNGILIGYVEIQGEQHFESRPIFRDSLEKIQERDERKRNYCKKNNIPLYEIVYRKGELINLDILPF